MDYTKNLQDNITTNIPIDRSIIHKWNTVIPMLMDSKFYIISTIDPVDANRYIFDFYGLLTFLDIPQEYHYPHLRVNGYTDPTAYTGNDVNIKILDTGTLATFQQLFKK